MNTKSLEADTRLLIDNNLKNLGWSLSGKDQNVFFERPKTISEQKKLKGKRPDYVLYSKEDGTPLIVIEAKKKGERIDIALEQGIYYAKQLEAPLVYATDGVFCKSFHVGENKVPQLNGEDVDEFIREALAMKFLSSWEVNTVSPKVQYDRKELIKIFDETNNMLRGDGLRAGIERFGEFSNILFLKLISETEDRKKLSGIQTKFNDVCHWDYIKSLKADSRIEHINKIVHGKLNSLYGTDIFTPLLIKDSTILKDIIDKLDPLTLTDVDSDIKGDAFEYFLKESTSTKNDLGEYFTPRHIVKTMVRLVNPQIGEKVYDPFCGTGGFLIESFRHIHNAMPRNSVTEEMLRKETIYGNEITNTARITKMNMILAGDGHSNINMRDSLASPIDGKYDVVIANMPYSQKTKYGNFYDLATNNGDSVCVQHCMKAISKLSEKGRMALVVPEGFLFRKDLAKTREYLLENSQLQSIISLPQGVFLPYTGVKTNIIYATKVNQKLKTKDKRSDFWYFDVKSDGYTLDNHRRKLNSPSDLAKYEEYRKLDEEQTNEMLQVGFDVIPLNKVRENSFVLVGGRYKEQKAILSKYEIVTLGEVAEYINGFPFKPSDWNSCGVPIIRIQNLTNTSKEINRTIKDDVPERYKVEKGDLLISWSATIGFYLWDGGNAYLNQHIFKVVPNKRILKKYLYFLKDHITTQIKEFVHGGTMKHIVKDDFCNIKIPLPPLDIQNQIVDEFEGYQNIIDGARKIVENYNPVIQIKGQYPSVKIGDICELGTGSTPSTQDRGNYEGGKIKWLVSGDIHKKIIYNCDGRVTQKGVKNARLKTYKVNSVLIALNGQGKTRGTVALLKIEATCNQSLVSIYPKDNRVLSEYLYYALNGMYQEIRDITGDKHRSGLNMPIIKEICISCPPIEVQQELVSQIEEEQALIESSKKLIEVFTKKIQDRINEIYKLN